VKVLDFGLAKLTELPGADTEAPTRAMVHTDAGTVMGTSHYMSPEQARGKNVDRHTDIWSLGVVLYEMAAGRVPFQGESATDVLSAITKIDPHPLARYTVQLPAEFEWIVMKALRKDPSERYQTAKELESDLRALKQRLEFEAQLERSIPPDRLSAALSPSDAKTLISQPATPAQGNLDGTVLAGRPTDVDSATTPRVSSAEYIVTEIKRHKLASVAVVLIAVAAIGLTTYFFRNRASALSEKDTILIADFVNTTGEPVFDGTLKQALAVQLGQSPFLNIFPEDRVRESLRFMGRGPDDRITRDIAREICERQGLKAMLIGTISGLGSHYVLTIEAINAHTGDSLAREQVEADSKEKVLSSLSKAASDMRSKLGESLTSIKKYEVPVEQATTSSLEALKAFALANEERTKGNSESALVQYKRAVELDPNFAMAYARIAVAYGNNDQMEMAQPYATKAFELRDRVSERERLYISEKYYNYVTGEIDKSIEVLQTWSQLYPNDYIPHNNLALGYMFLGKYDEAVKQALEAIRLSPNNISARENSIACFIHLGRFDEAQKALDEMTVMFPQSALVHVDSYQLAFLRGDQATMDRELQWSKGKPSEPQFVALAAATFESRGQMKQAMELRLRQIELDKTADRKENAAGTMVGAIAGNQSLVGNCAAAIPNAEKGLALMHGRVTSTGATLVFATCKDSARTQPLIDEMLKLYPKDTVAVGLIVPWSNALLEMGRGNNTEAINILESLRRFDFGLFAGSALTYSRGYTYLQQRSAKEAAAEFQAILDRRGVDPGWAGYALSHVGLARAAVMMGDTAKARKEYQDFFALWKDADPDLPILLAAKKEYAELK
jgi:tetratricopeptide (TPR) repeat protein